MCIGSLTPLQFENEFQAFCRRDNETKKKQEKFNSGKHHLMYECVTI